MSQIPREEIVAMIQEATASVFSTMLNLRADEQPDRQEQGDPAPVDGVVALLGENSGAYVECLYAIPASGRRALLLNYRHHPDEWAAMLARTESALVIGDSELLDRLAAAHPELDTTPMVGLDARPDGLDLASFRDRHDSAPEHPRSDPDTVAWLVPTSGTTGTPKIAMLTHRSLLAAADGCATARPVAPDDVYLFVFPLCHIAAYNVLVYHRFGRPVVVERRFDVETTLAAVEQHRVTAASLAPTMLAMILDTPGALERHDVSTLRSIAYGSSAIPEPVLRRAMQQLPCNFSQGYGMTELSGNCVYLGPDDHRRGVAGESELLRTAGFPTPIVEVAIVDDDGNRLPAGEPGTVWMKMGSGTFEYKGDKAKTSKSHDAEGFFTVGDMGYLNDDGYLFLCDRKADMIIAGGVNIYPAEIEAAILEHPQVGDVAVFGIPDDDMGEQIKAVVEPIADVAADAALHDSIMEHVHGRLAKFKWPRSLDFVDELPREPTGKLLKRKLRDPYWEGRDRAI